MAESLGVRNRASIPPLTVPQILAWTDEHHRRTGAWPHVRSGPIAAAPGETWLAVEAALSIGNRGLPGGSSLAQVLLDRSVYWISTSMGL